MDPKIHPLQQASVDLIKSLYTEKKLPITSGMRTVLAGYYPSVESVLNTLEQYKKDTYVQAFLRSHKEIVESAKRELEAFNKIASDENTQQSDFFSGHEEVNTYDIIKKKSLTTIEKELSNTLSTLCNEELSIEINSVEGSSDIFNNNVEMRVSVKPK